MMGWGDGGWGAGSWGAGGWVAMSVMMIVFWGMVVAAVAWAVRARRGNSVTAGREDHAQALLAERFARGEIDGEEFTRGRDLLRGKGPTRAGSR